MKDEYDYSFECWGMFVDGWEVYWPVSAYQDFIDNEKLEMTKCTL